MAKKSAKSKGYRKQTVKKPYLSKRDITLLCVLVAALAVAAFFLFRYDDGALKVKDGAVVAEGDNWLIANGSNTRGHARYFKLGEIGEIEGFTRQAGALASDPNIPEYTFTADAEDSDIASLTVTSSHNASEALAKYAASMLSDIDGNEVGEVLSGELAGVPATYFTYTVQPVIPESDEAETSEAEAEEAQDDAAKAEEPDDEAASFSKVMSGYIDASHDCCVVIHVESRADTAEGIASDEALTALLEQAIQAVTLEADK